MLCMKDAQQLFDSCEILYPAHPQTRVSVYEILCSNFLFNNIYTNIYILYTFLCIHRKSMYLSEDADLAVGKKKYLELFSFPSRDDQQRRRRWRDA